MDYVISTHFSEYPTKYYAGVLAQNAIIKAQFPNGTANSFAKLKRSLVSVNIYYDQLQFIAISHDIKMIASDLLGEGFSFFFI